MRYNPTVSDIVNRRDHLSHRVNYENRWHRIERILNIKRDMCTSLLEAFTRSLCKYELSLLVVYNGYYTETYPMNNSVVANEIAESIASYGSDDENTDDEDAVNYADEASLFTEMYADGYVEVSLGEIDAFFNTIPILDIDHISNIKKAMDEVLDRQLNIVIKDDIMRNAFILALASEMTDRAVILPEVEYLEKFRQSENYYIVSEEFKGYLKGLEDVYEAEFDLDIVRILLYIFVYDNEEGKSNEINECEYDAETIAV